MPRPQKKRCVCCKPKNSNFYPSNPCSDKTVILTVDEYESIRLIDLEDYTQAQCAKQMNVARTTVQGIYNQARKKIADALIHGKKLTISGGDYVLCQKSNEKCKMGCRRCCPKQNLNKLKQRS